MSIIVRSIQLNLKQIAIDSIFVTSCRKVYTNEHNKSLELKRKRKYWNIGFFNGTRKYKISTDVHVLHVSD